MNGVKNNMATNKLKIGDSIPTFNKLPAVDGKSYSLIDFDDKKILIIVFSCNHCPYVKAYEPRMIELQKKYKPEGVQLIAINSNETVNYPEDKFEKMVQNAKEKNFNFVYLRDEDQSVADAFGATHTPEFFVFDEKRILRYHGKMDDNWQDPRLVKENYVSDAIDAIIKNLPIKTTETYSIGCTIKWR